MITNSKWSLILKVSFWRIFKVMRHLIKPQTLLKYCPSRKDSRVPNRVYAMCLWSMYVNAPVFHTAILILTNLHPCCRRPSTSSCCEARNYRKNLAMEIHILGRNYGETCQSSSKYCLCLGVPKSKNFGWFAIVSPWLKCLATPVLKKGYFKLVFGFSENLNLHYSMDWNRTKWKSEAEQLQCKEN